MQTLQFRKTADEKAVDHARCGKQGLLPCFTYGPPTPNDPRVVLRHAAGMATLYIFECGCTLTTMRGLSA